VGDNASHPASGVFSVSFIPGDYMAMAVHHGLAGSSSYIEPDIVPEGFWIFFDHPLTVTSQFEYRTFFLTGQVEEIRFMAERDYQHMSSGHRILIPAGIAYCIHGDDHVSGWGTERAGYLRLHASNPLTFNDVVVPLILLKQPWWYSIRTSPVTKSHQFIGAESIPERELEVGFNRASYIFAVDFAGEKIRKVK
jgi:hypothetical protein